MKITLPIFQDQIEQHNSLHAEVLKQDYEMLASKLERAGCNIEDITSRVEDFSVAIPSWGMGRGGTRFARFPLAGEPTNFMEKLEDCAVVNQLSQLTPSVSPHFPWDKSSDYTEVKDYAESLGLGFDAVNSNTFQDQSGQGHSYCTGSLSSTLEETRNQAIEHNLECIEIGKQLGSKAITVWVGDGSNFPGQQNLVKAFERYLDSAAEIYSALPDDWSMLIEHKMFEPAFYSTVIQDWGSSILAAQTLGEKAKCLVDLGHHAPNVNIEQIVARLHHFGKLGGFHFNDSKYGDDDLDSGIINPHQLFLVFNELVEAELNPREGFNPSYMIDQSHNVTDPIESVISSAEEIASAFAKALLVDRKVLNEAQELNDAMLASQTLRAGYRIDVSPIVAMARFRKSGAIDPLSLYRESNWRSDKARSRVSLSNSAGIV